LILPENEKKNRSESKGVVGLSIGYEEKVIGGNENDY